MAVLKQSIQKIGNQKMKSKERDTILEIRICVQYTIMYIVHCTVYSVHIYKVPGFWLDYWERERERGRDRQTDRESQRQWPMETTFLLIILYPHNFAVRQSNICLRKFCYLWTLYQLCRINIGSKNNVIVLSYSCSARRTTLIPVF